MNFFSVLLSATVLYNLVQCEVKIEGLRHVEAHDESCNVIGNSHGVESRITISREEKRVLFLRLPSRDPGIYTCGWNIKIDAGDGSLGLRIELYGKRAFGIDYIKRWQCIGFIDLYVPDLDFSFPEYYFCRNDAKTFISPDNIHLKLRMNVTNETEIDDNETFIAEISVGPRPELPKRFKVGEIAISNDTKIKDFTFTWKDARNFCKEKSQTWDLCHSEERYACSWRMHFSHSRVSEDPQYFPTLPYNTWGKVDAETNSCKSTDGPPSWGLDRKKCPENGCASKSYIYCCHHQQPVFLSKRPIRQTVFVTSGISHLGRNHYRFSTTPDINYNDDYYEYEDTSSPKWGDHWITVGRIAGDIRRLQLFENHTPRSPVPVYFCSRTVDETTADQYRFSASLVPCKAPWDYEFHAYASTKPRRGWRRIYFGQSTTGEGTRVSVTPPCCGYDDPERSFIVYGIVRNGWKSKLTSRFCGMPKWFTDSSGRISSDLLANNYKFPLHCSWRIMVQSDRGIQIRYSFEPSKSKISSCSRDYLRFSSLKKGLIYGRACGIYQNGNFTTKSNNLSVDFVLEDSHGRFSLTYIEVNHPAPTPTQFTLNNSDATWRRAADVCKEHGAYLCLTKEICPIGGYPFGGKRESLLWTAVADNVNDWIQLGPESDGVGTCLSHTSIQGPPEWGMRSYDDTNSTLPNRDVVYCCKRAEDDRRELLLPSPLHPVRVNVAVHNEMEKYYWFGRADEWESPAYRFFYDDPFHYSEHDLETVYPWKPPSTIEGASANAIDYFVLSREYEESVFDQTVYFCTNSESYGSSIVTPFKKFYQLSLNGCRGKWVYNFHLYGGERKSQKCEFELQIGSSDQHTDFVCCQENAQNFTIFVINAGRLDYETTEPDYNQ